MRRFFTKKSFPILLGLAAIFFVVPHLAHAGWIDDLLTVGIRLVFETIILPLASAILALSGMLLDKAINFGLHTGYLFSLSPAINLGWTIIRDIANMFFIFILIYISIGTIVNGTGFGTKQLLTKVIVAALLINFSLFFTKIVIDVSNIFGNWLYGGVMTTLDANKSGTEAPSISDLISARLGIIQWWRITTGGSNATTNTSESQSNLLTDPSKNIVAIFLRLAVVLIAIYIFVYTAVLFLSRSITLLFLLVFSPVGFMGGVLPQIKKYSGEWREELTTAAMFPIVYLLMLYISLQFINSLGTLGLNNLKDKAFGGVSVSLYFQYILIIFLLKATLKVAKDYSGEMGKTLGGIAESLAKTAVGVAGGGAALVGKIAIGGMAARLADNTRLNQVVAGGGVKGLIAGGVKSGLGNVADFHFDTRAGLGLAGVKPQKGYKSMIKDMTKDQEEAQKAIAAKPKETKPAKDQLELAEDAAYRRHGELGQAYIDAHERFETAKGNGRNTPELRKAYDAAERDLNKMKSAIESDAAYEYKKKLLDEQERRLKEMNMTDAERQAEIDAVYANNEYSEDEKLRRVHALEGDRNFTAEEKKTKAAAMAAAMRQGRAAKTAESGLGVEIAKAVAFNPFSEQGRKDYKEYVKSRQKAVTDADTAVKKVGAIATNILAAAAATANVASGGWGYWGGSRYAADNKKIADKMRDAMDEGKQKKNQKDMQRLLADLAEEGGGGAAPAAPAAPAGGGGGAPAGGGH